MMQQPREAAICRARCGTAEPAPHGLLGGRMGKGAGPLGLKPPLFPCGGVAGPFCLHGVQAP